MIMKKANPTVKTQEEIIEILEKKNVPMSVSTLAKEAGKTIYQAKASIEFLEKMGIIEKVVSSGNTTLVIMKAGEEESGRGN